MKNHSLTGCTNETELPNKVHRGQHPTHAIYETPGSCDGMTTTCQICARAIKSKFGLIAHHGYQRNRNDSGNTLSCRGAREVPYEVGREAIPPFIEMLKRNHVNQQNAIRKLSDERTEFWHRGRMVKPSEPSYDMTLKSRLFSMEQALKYLDYDIHRLQKRYDSWTGVDDSWKVKP